MRVRFLGTGPAAGRPGRGRSRRSESSLLVTATDHTILIDATRDFAHQVRGIAGIDAVLLTHAHRDATGGIGQLDRWLRSRVPVWATRGTVEAMTARHRELSHLDLRVAASRSPVEWRDSRFVPLLVPHAPDCTTFAWRIEHGSASLVYASDVARLTRSLEALCDDCDLLVLDGAMWRRRLYTHLEIGAAVSIVRRWAARRILFTQLGRSTPDHASLDRWLRGIDRRIGAAYDGLEVELGASRRRDHRGAPRRAS
jgi:phosphoribosyl 1,2-cyclic phosphodiesterase